MKNILTILVLLGGVQFAQTASAQACGNVTGAGTCSGDLQQVCDNGQLVQEDCSFNGNTCGYINTQGQDFALCLAPVGDSCVVPDGNGGNMWQFCDDVSGPVGCNLLTGLCVAVASSCLDSETGQCAGNTLVSQCVGGQGVLVECLQVGATGCSGNICTGAVIGAQCADGIIECEAGLACGTPDAQGVQLCEQVSDPVPFGWSCPDASYDAGNLVCNCDCGAYDPDCSEDNATISGCQATVAEGVKCSSTGQCIEPVDVDDDDDDDNIGDDNVGDDDDDDNNGDGDDVRSDDDDDDDDTDSRDSDDDDDEDIRGGGNTGVGSNSDPGSAGPCGQSTSFFPLAGLFALGLLVRRRK